MTWSCRTLGACAIVLASTVSAAAQNNPQPPLPSPSPPLPAPAGGVRAESPPNTGNASAATPATDAPAESVTFPYTGPITELPEGAMLPLPHAAGLEAESLPAELEEDILQPPLEVRWGPTPVSQVNFLMDYLRLRDLFGDTGIRSFG